MLCKAIACSCAVSTEVKRFQVSSLNHCSNCFYPDSGKGLTFTVLYSWPVCCWSHWEVWILHTNGQMVHLLSQHLRFRRVGVSTTWIMCWDKFWIESSFRSLVSPGIPHTVLSVRRAPQNWCSSLWYRTRLPLGQRGARLEMDCTVGCLNVYFTLSSELYWQSSFIQIT